MQWFHQHGFQSSLMVWNMYNGGDNHDYTGVEGPGYERGKYDHICFKPDSLDDPCEKSDGTSDFPGCLWRSLSKRAKKFMCYQYNPDQLDYDAYPWQRAMCGGVDPMLGERVELDIGEHTDERKNAAVIGSSGTINEPVLSNTDANTLVVKNDQDLVHCRNQIVSGPAEGNSTLAGTPFFGQIQVTSQKIRIARVDRLSVGWAPGVVLECFKEQTVSAPVKPTGITNYPIPDDGVFFLMGRKQRCPTGTEIRAKEKCEMADLHARSGPVG
jgi:hypothetical protein